jgi:hypothetical protein
VIVLAVEREADGATIVTVLPITHSAPTDRASAVENPVAGQTASRARRRPVLDRSPAGGAYLPGMASISASKP